MKASAITLRQKRRLGRGAIFVYRFDGENEKKEMLNYFLFGTIY
jgi:hypothetical protein